MEHNNILSLHNLSHKSSYLNKCVLLKALKKKNIYFYLTALKWETIFCEVIFSYHSILTKGFILHSQELKQGNSKMRKKGGGTKMSEHIFNTK